MSKPEPEFVTPQQAMSAIRTAHGPKAAMAVIDRAMTQWPADPFFAARKLQYLSHQGDFDKATKCARYALDHTDIKADPVFMRAALLTLLAGSTPDNIVSTLQQHPVEQTNSPIIRNAMTSTHIHLGNRDAAIASAEAGLREFPAHHFVRCMATVAYNRFGDTQAAITNAYETRRHFQNNSFVGGMLTRTLLCAGEYAQARSEAEYNLITQPESSYAHYLIARTALACGQPQIAHEQLGRLQDRWSDHNTTHSLQGELLLRAGHPDKAASPLLQAQRDGLQHYESTLLLAAARRNRSDTMTGQLLSQQMPTTVFSLLTAQADAISRDVSAIDRLEGNLTRAGLSADQALFDLASIQGAARQYWKVSATRQGKQAATARKADPAQKSSFS